MVYSDLPSLGKCAPPPHSTFTTPRTLTILTCPYDFVVSAFPYNAPPDDLLLVMVPHLQKIYHPIVIASALPKTVYPVQLRSCYICTPPPSSTVFSYRLNVAGLIFLKLTVPDTTWYAVKHHPAAMKLSHSATTRCSRIRTVWFTPVPAYPPPPLRARSQHTRFSAICTRVRTRHRSSCYIYAHRRQKSLAILESAEAPAPV